MTDIGIKRSVNQDRAVYKIKDHEIVGVLCDGMGGHLAGDVASTLVSNYIIDHFFDHSPFINDESIHAWISSLLLTANDLLNKESDMHSEYAGMGTTIVICYKIEEDYRAILLCSDGLYNSLTSQQIEDILKEDESVNHKTERLIQSANEFGGLDNIGVLLIEKGES